MADLDKATAASEGTPLKVHDLRPAPGANKRKTRKGRGEASKGKTAGRGTKGQKARHNTAVRLGFEGGQIPLTIRVPKLKGFKNPNRVEFQVVNLDKLAELYPQGGEVTAEDLAARGAVRSGRPVKILGTGDISVAVQVKVHAFSGSAKEKIVAAGGTADTL